MSTDTDGTLLDSGKHIRRRPRTGSSNKKSRKVIPWPKVRAELRRRNATRYIRPQLAVDRPASIVMFSTDPFRRGRSKLQPSAAPGSSLPAADLLRENHVSVGLDSRLGHQFPGPQTSSATPALPVPGGQSQGGAACTDPAGHTSVPATEVSSCPIMGKTLPIRQREENYPPETHFSDRLLAFPDMAKSPPEQEPESIKVLRANSKRLRAGRSFRALAKEAGVPETVGRSINNLETPGNNSRIDLVVAAAEVYRVDVWQMFVPSVAELSSEELKQLRRLVKSFVTGGEAMRRLLTAQLDLNTPAAEEVRKRMR